MTSSAHSAVHTLKDIHFEGNIIPIPWFNHITFENGRPDTNAILLLSDIVYWYRPAIVRDEGSGQVLGYQKKFRADLLQKNYQDYENLFGFSKKQIRDAFVRLEEIGVIRRVFRTVETGFGYQSNVMFIDLFADKVREITHKVPPIDIEIERGVHESKEGVTLKLQGRDKEVKTYTKNTPEITAKTTTHTDGRADVSQKMLEVWNETLEPSVPVQITPFRSSKLKFVLQQHFQQSLEQWKAFCRDLTRSPFLMGKGQRGWRVTLDWILEADNLRKTLEGNYRDSGDKNASEPSVSPSELEQKVRQHFGKIEDPVLRQFSQGLIRVLGASKYLSWLRDVEITEYTPQRFVLSFSSRFKRNYVQTHYDDKILSVARSLFPARQIQWIDYAVKESSSSKTSSSCSSPSGSISPSNAEIKPELRSHVHVSSQNSPERFLSGDVQATFSGRRGGTGQPKGRIVLTPGKEASAVSHIHVYSRRFSQNSVEVV
jgi:hypothetical protein